ncbi:type 11 methyltransferase [Vibrio nigripulchritudo ATCC 27043]|uniref:class I SAM-dependent methyltransferase n=1 Tax=Vibrio nigripulchritudo TaxID=28173 RepID=UPI00021C2636|nr:class I SAM-dependent methyltransferase [Vibrio nigripulchritudo]EGU60369.1 type 11 methyltransferase [Vibrio nigripulchritudo ATCC 27043]
MSEWDSVADTVNFNLKISINEFLAAVPFGSKILDFGCGYGRITKQLSDLGYSDVVGIDSSKEMVSRGISEDPELDLRHSSTEVLPFSGGEFDSIVLCAVLTCIPEQNSRNNVLSELRRVLKPQGVIYLAEFCSDQSLRFMSGTGVSMWHSSKSELERLLKDFKIESSKVVDTPTMSGHESKASHIIAQKVI